MEGKIVIHNAQKASLLLRIEPWADEYDLAPGESRTIRVKGPDPAEVEITIDTDTLAVWGWAGSVLDGDA